MSNANRDKLFQLIKHLSKSEKRHFRLYVERSNKSSNSLFVRLFDLLEKQDSYNEASIYKKIKAKNKKQLTNLKLQLYRQILKSLRLLYANKDKDFIIREQIDYARILYRKGFYLESLKMLKPLKMKAVALNLDFLLMEIIEFEKYIEERHITRSRKVKNKMELLLTASESTAKKVNRLVKLSNLKIKIHGLYIKMGHIRDEKDYDLVKAYFQSNLGDFQVEELSTLEQIYLQQCYMWYYYILLDYQNCYTHAQRWVQLFDQNPALKASDPGLYMRGVSYTLSLLYYQKKKDQFVKELERFEQYTQRAAASFNENQKMLNFIYLYTAKINDALLSKDFKKAIAQVPFILSQLKHYELQLDSHRQMVFNYKIAWLYFCDAQYDRCIEHTDRIIRQKQDYLREDLQCYARLLHLMAHFELRHTELLPYLLQSVKRFFVKMKELNEVQKCLFSFLNKHHRLKTKSEMKEHFGLLRKDIVKLYQNPYERRAFQHLDLLYWIENKML